MSILKRQVCHDYLSGIFNHRDNIVPYTPYSILFSSFFVSLSRVKMLGAICMSVKKTDDVLSSPPPQR